MIMYGLMGRDATIEDNRGHRPFGGTSVTPIYVHNPASIPWQMNPFDLVMLSILIVAGVYSGVQFRRGRRGYAVLMLTAFIYGLVLELGGMATHNSYTQGTFTVMLNWPALQLFQNSTQMPSYVPIF